jgi:serine/threonine protein phosphatase PrpC
MKFITDNINQNIKTGYDICGDYCLCSRTSLGTLFLVCDGIGSGVYANIAAISCAERIMEMYSLGLSLSHTSETVAASMHRARTEDIPFSAFSAALIRPDGQFIIYTYEAPPPILIQNEESARVLKPRFYTTEFEVLGETLGKLEVRDALLLSSDGVTQAGMGRGYSFGVGSDGIVNFINKTIKSAKNLGELSRSVTDMCSELNGGRYHDDTTLAILRCKEANELTILTGPPSKKTLDGPYARSLLEAPGKKVVCGSTTAEIVGRELGLKLELINLDANLGLPPEYSLDGIDLVAEGAITLNQVYNVLDDPIDLFQESVVKKFCVLLREADIIYFKVGMAVNEAHESLIFKQLGVRVRKTTLRMLTEKLKKMGKLVLEKNY